MGQRLTEEKQEILRCHPDVLFVTNEHIVLRNGKVLDPSEFPLQAQQAIFIRKLATCACGKHKAGLHEMVPVRRWVTILGTYIDDPYRSRMCPLGEWTVEEVLVESQIRELFGSGGTLIA